MKVFEHSFKMLCNTNSKSEKSADFTSRHQKWGLVLNIET